MQQNKCGCPRGCRLCQKQSQIQEMRGKRKRDLSLQSIYRKDYHNSLANEINHVGLPQISSKNQSSNIIGKRKNYLNLNSTYLANFAYNNPEKPFIVHSKETLPHRDGLLESYKSTYNTNYHQYPVVDAHQSYKIADFQFYNIKTPFPHSTQYKEHYHSLERKNGYEKQDKKYIKQPPEAIRLFETTQKCSYKGNLTGRSPAILPAPNLSTLPTSSFLYKSTYKQEFKSAGPKNLQQTISHNVMVHNGGRSSFLKNYYF